MTETELERGREILLSLIYPTCICDMSEAQKNEFERAAAQQAEYAAQNKSCVVRESVGDVSVTYADSQNITCGGERISPISLGILKTAGLLERWV